MERSAADFLPPKLTLKALREAAAGCRGCDLYKHATQTIFGEGKARARVMLVGEQPGDREDVEGHPFVGPAGKLLHRALDEAGLNPNDAYITNAVKHFKFIVKGKRRIHATPRVIEMRACEPWLDTENPSSILRARDDETRHREYAMFVGDLRIVAGLVRA